ncbi:Phenylalanine-specific permease [Klebsiella pneumoniae]|nr:Phenylalanine-specific permease [Klebsiella pneumoniae]
MQGNAPKFLARVSKRGVPVNSLLLSGIITSLVVVLNYLLPHEALGLLMALVVATLLLNWIMICMAHLKFRAAQRRKGRESKFKALLAPASNCYIAFLGLIGADVHYRRHASVGDPAAGVDPVPVYRLQTAAPPGVSEMPRRPAGLPAFLL